MRLVLVSDYWYDGCEKLGRGGFGEGLQLLVNRQEGIANEHLPSNSMLSIESTYEENRNLHIRSFPINPSFRTLLAPS
jgi:hypothetical protein